MNKAIKVREPSEGIRRRKEIGLVNSGSGSLLVSGLRDDISYVNEKNLIPFHNQARKIFDEEKIYELAASIKEYGIRQPLTVINSQRHEGKFEVVSGERRLKASRIAELERIPCIILKDQEQANEIALIENIQREDLHPVELARALSVLVEGKPYGIQTELSKKIGMNVKKINELLNMLKSPQEVLNTLVEKNIRNRDQIRKILNSETPLQEIELEKNKENEALSKKTNVQSMSFVKLDDDFNLVSINDKKIAKLNNEQKDNFKKTLNKILNDLP